MKIHNHKRLDGYIDKKDEDIALIILNNKIDKESSLFEYIWSLASITICADGGANQLFDYTTAQATNVPNHIYKTYIPQYIVGDLDSIQEEVKLYYNDAGTKIVQISDQDTSDLDKSLSILKSLRQVDRNITVIVFGAFGGRFDHEMYHINVLYTWLNIFEDIILLSDFTMTTLLPEGQNKIIISELIEGPHCGLIPIGERCLNVTTQGLVWNLTNSPLFFGGNVGVPEDLRNRIIDARPTFSACNLIKGEEIIVNCSHPILWTTEVKSKWREKQTSLKARGTFMIGILTGIIIGMVISFRYKKNV